MNGVFDYAPVAATACAIPQFLPQISKLRRTNDTAGISWSWATLTSVNNVAWALYFALSRFWTALVPAFSATLLAGVLAVMLYRRGRPPARLGLLMGGWITL
ncbi:MAG TPA: PQ-loop domain-containing transporter, partial [Acidothermaceae bacterium]|nr:PQ-loop domain-containing transporter [Acidothermaceae bacterium]